jgi:hypothetical protein
LRSGALGQRGKLSERLLSSDRLAVIKIDADQDGTLSVVVNLVSSR